MIENRRDKKEKKKRKKTRQKEVEKYKYKLPAVDWGIACEWQGFTTRRLKNMGVTGRRLMRLRSAHQVEKRPKLKAVDNLGVVEEHEEQIEGAAAD